MFTARYGLGSYISQLVLFLKKDNFVYRHGSLLRNMMFLELTIVCGVFTLTAAALCGHNYKSAEILTCIMK